MTDRARIILFRGMNTGGVRAPVSAQRALALQLGLQNPRTLLASGNLVVDSDLDPANIEAMIETAMGQTFGLNIAAMVRTGHHWAELVAANPFAEEAKADPAKVLAMVMKAGFNPAARDELSALATGGEMLEVVRLPTGGTVAYFWFPQGQGRSVLAEKATPRRIGVGTGRNWNTVLKLAEMVAA